MKVPLPPPLCHLTHIRWILQFLLSAAIVGTAIANSQSLHTRADTTTIGDFAVYNVSECVSTGLGLLSSNIYQVRVSQICHSGNERRKVDDQGACIRLAVGI